MWRDVVGRLSWGHTLRGALSGKVSPQATGIQELVGIQ